MPAEVRALAIDGSWVFTPQQFRDDRGTFLEWFQGAPVAAAVGAPMPIAQANVSVSRRGALRGVHYADVPPGQAKYVTCTRGAVLDVVVDLRTGSATYGGHDAVRLDDSDRRGIYLAEGLGHAFLALTDDATVAYLCSTPYEPTREHGVNPLDPALGLPWPPEVPPLLSPKDAAAPSLAAAERDGLLPAYADCRDLYARRRGGQ